MINKNDFRIPMVMDASKMNYFTRASAIRFGAMSTAGALQGLGSAKLSEEGEQGYTAPPLPGEQDHVATNFPEKLQPRVPSTDGGSILDSIKSFFTGKDTGYTPPPLPGDEWDGKKYVRSKEATAWLNDNGSFQLPTGQTMGIPTWALVGGGLLLGVVAIAVITKK